jgi:MoaA/NifB/PqqE/SkfB family radical SAM enzyme
MLCNIPFTEYYLSYGDAIISCCAMTPSTKHPIISIEDLNTESDLFFHQELAVIRKDFKNNITPELCKVCLDVNNSRGFKTPELCNVDTKLIKNFEEGTTKVKQLKIGSFRQCNLQCKMCHPDKSTALAQILDVRPNMVNKNLDEISKNKTNYAIRQIQKGNLNNCIVSLCGGEPLVDSTLDELFYALKENPKVGVTLISNLAVGTNKSYERLDIVCNRDKSKIVWSCDGPPEIHEYIRNCNIENINKSFEFLKVFYPNQKIMVNSTLHSLNVNYYQQLLKYIESIECTSKINFLYDQRGVIALEVLPKEILHKYYLDLLQTNVDCSISLNLKQDQLLVTIKNVLNKEFDKKKWEKFCNYIDIFDKAQNKNVFDFYPEFKEFWINE